MVFQPEPEGDFEGFEDDDDTYVDFDGRPQYVLPEIGDGGGEFEGFLRRSDGEGSSAPRTLPRALLNSIRALFNRTAEVIEESGVRETLAETVSGGVGQVAPIAPQGAFQNPRVKLRRSQSFGGPFPVSQREYRAFRRGLPRPPTARPFDATKDAIARSERAKREREQQNERSKLGWMVENESAHAHASHVPSGFPDVYVNGEDVTTTIDPISNSLWITDTSHAKRHMQSVARGKLKDHKGVMDTLHLLSREHASKLDTLFVPNSFDLDEALKFTPKCVGNPDQGEMRVGRGPDAGQLPTISKMIWKGALSDKPDYLCEQEMWRSRDVNSRFFDCRGHCR
tara:strand:+ start:844 stop:1863 length:1020 start_codon:yes stop_codon:yes gene_type:complete